MRRLRRPGQPPAAPHGARIGRPLGALLLCLSLGASAALAPLLVAPAQAAPGKPGGTGEKAYPSQEQVERAEAKAARTAGDVGAIKAELTLANQRLEQAAVRAEQASEAYNGARWELEQARDAVRAARADAKRARQEVAGQRDLIGALVAQSYQDAGDLNALHAMMSADGPEGVLDQYAAFQGASTSTQADYQRYAASESLARVFTHKAAQAEAQQEQLAARAEKAQQQAVSAAEAAQGEADAIAAQKDDLIRELARAQDISVALARQRQSALEEIARERAAARARAEAAAAAKAEAAAQAKAAAAAARQKAATTARAPKKAEKVEKRADQPSRGDGGGSGDGKGDDRGGSTGGTGGGGGGTTPTPTPTPPPPAADPPSPGGGAQAAIRFAKAQLGEPYRWGATGPDSWDCSGLTMKAWAQGGRSLPHYSVAQYDVGVRISVGDLRPGDLVFWSSNGRASGIHHVALYIGNGQIIHAPRTGRPVAINDLYYWTPPTFFTRV